MHVSATYATDGDLLQAPMVATVDAHQVSCSVVCYDNPPAQIERVLACIRACGAIRRIYLLDNSRIAGLGGLARSVDANYVHLPKSPGYGRAHNFAIRCSLAQGSHYHLVLNPNIEFAPEVIPAMLAYMASHPEVGLLSPRMAYPNGQPQHPCKLLPTPLDLLIRRFCPPLHRRTGRQAKYELHDSGYDRIMDVPALSGCFMLIRGAVLRDIGGFDERFFLYFDDVDLTRRIGAVARTLYFPHVSIVHDYGKGSYKGLRLTLCHARSAIRYFNKWGWFADAQRDHINRNAIRRLPVRTS